MSVILAGLGWAVLGLASVGVLYAITAGVLLRRFFRKATSGGGLAADGEGVTILKPLHGLELALETHLASFFEQDAAGPVQIVFGSNDPADPALAVAESLALAHPAYQAIVRGDSTIHGQNRKISNLINMMAGERHPIIVLSDSDIAVRPDYLRRVCAALAEPGVGVVTCPYFGKSLGGFWSDLAAMGVSYQFLPNVITGVSLGAAKPCMGSTIALRRDTLDRIGGFQAFNDVLADDYQIGAAVRGLGLKSVVAPVLVAHGGAEAGLDELFAHELRWAKTIRGVDPAGHAGSVVTHPLALSLIAGLLLGFSAPSIMAIAAAFAARVWLMRVIDRIIGRELGPWWLIPLRDMLSFCVFVGSFFVRSVEWRGAKFQVSKNGDLKPV